MKPLLRLIAMALVVIFTFSSVAWAGAVEYKDLPQDQSQIGLPSEQDMQSSTQPPPRIKKNPPATHKPPVVHNPPLTHKPPVVHNPPATHKPPVVHNPPSTHKPPVVHNPPATHKPPVVHNPPSTHKPPVVHNPPSTHKPPVVHNPPSTHRPPVVHNPPSTHRPPVVHNPPSTHRPPVVHNPPSTHRPPFIHNPNHDRHWNHEWPHDRPWHRYFNDWNWFVGFGVLSLGAYYLDDNYDRVMYVHFEPENKMYLQEVTTRYGDYNYRERISGFDGEGWRYYWTGEQNVICVFVRDDGYTHTFIWNRAETESQAITLGLLTTEQLAVYSPYSADMPPTLAEEYINLVIWSQTEWK